MSTGVPVPTPDIHCVAATPDNTDGHFCVCTVCGQEFNVLVTEVAFLDENGVQRGFTSDYDLSEYVTHFQTAHPDGT